MPYMGETMSINALKGNFHSCNQGEFSHFTNIKEKNIVGTSWGGFGFLGFFLWCEGLGFGG